MSFISCMHSKYATIRLGLLAERRREHAASRAADAVRVGEGARLRLAARVLRNGHEAGDTATLLVLPAHEVARAFGRDEHHVEIWAR
jgi:hypothetical protein